MAVTVVQRYKLNCHPCKKFKENMAFYLNNTSKSDCFALLPRTQNSPIGRKAKEKVHAFLPDGAVLSCSLLYSRFSASSPILGLIRNLPF